MMILKEKGDNNSEDYEAKYSYSCIVQYFCIFHLIVFLFENHQAMLQLKKNFCLESLEIIDAYLMAFNIYIIKIF